MAGQTIGTGAVMLTANSDALLTGLNKAQAVTEKWAGEAAKRVNKAGSAAGGKSSGLMGGIMFGGAGLAAGGPAGAALAVGGLALKGLEQFAERLSEVGEKSKQYGNIDPGTQKGIDRAQGGMDRMSAAVDEFMFKAAGTLAPIIEKIASGLEVIGFVGAEGFDLIVTAATDVATEIGTWLGVLDEVGEAHMTTSEVVFAFLRGVGHGFAYLWDTIKAGAGVVSYIGGVITEGFGSVVQVIAGAAKELDKLAQELPEAIRPDWIKGAAGAMGGFGEKVEGIGAGMKKWGKGAVDGFGNSVGKVDKWLDGVEAKFAATDRLMKNGDGAAGGGGNMLGGAFQQNSTQAYSVVAQFQAGNQIADGQKRMEQLARDNNNLLRDIKDKLEPVRPLIL